MRYAGRRSGRRCEAVAYLAWPALKATLGGIVLLSHVGATGVVVSCKKQQTGLPLLQTRFPVLQLRLALLQPGRAEFQTRLPVVEGQFLVLAGRFPSVRRPLAWWQGSFPVLQMRFPASEEPIPRPSARFPLSQKGDDLDLPDFWRMPGRSYRVVEQ